MPDPKRLLLSSWNICLDNLPEGEAQQANRISCVSQDDLLAPYHERELSNHNALCAVLGEHFGIKLSPEDF
jgi:hypothetical protein